MTRLFPALALVLAIAACSPSDDEPSKASGAAVVGLGVVTADDFKSATTVKDLMTHVIDFNSFGVWNRQGWLINAEGTHELFPTTEAEWLAAINASYTLAEASNVLLLPGRPREDDRRWVDAAHMLYDAAMKAKDAAVRAEAAFDEKNVDVLKKEQEAFFDAGGEIYEACVVCHGHFVQGDAPGADAKLPQLPNRVKPGTEPSKPNQ